MSTAYGRDTVAFHFSWYRDQAKVDALLPKLEAALAPFDPRPHWGKTFAFTARDLEAKYPRMDEFRGLMAKLDPRGTFHNDFLRERILGQAD
jgi:xylitol oxidase